MVLFSRVSVFLVLGRLVAMERLPERCLFFRVCGLLFLLEFFLDLCKQRKALEQQKRQTFTHTSKQHKKTQFMQVQQHALPLTKRGGFSFGFPFGFPFNEA